MFDQSIPSRTLRVAAIVTALAIAPQASLRAQATSVPAYNPKALSMYKKPSADELKRRLTPEQFVVTQEEGTETPFHNEYWNNHEAGIYVDVVSGEPLFSSLDKFESGTGWPSFTRPLVPSNIKSRSDQSLGMDRTEVRSAHANSHLGHVFDDGPKPTGLRYCMNSAAMRFIPASKLVESGYGEFAHLFQTKK